MTVEIGNKHVGEGQPVYVIAEIGGNHDGDFNKAVELIYAAASAGADAAKFQYFNPETLYPGRVTPGSIRPGWLEPLQDVCWKDGIEFLCSIFDMWTLDQYLRIDPPAVKIASPEATDFELLGAVADAGASIIVSTGAMTWDDTDRMNNALTGVERIYLHCVSAYPAQGSEVNLRCIRTMSDRYSVPVGFSDHTAPPANAAILAVAAGACMIERHVTLDRGGTGPDHAFSCLPDELAYMVDAIRAVEVGLGDGVKRVAAGEDPTDRRT